MTITEVANKLETIERVVRKWIDSERLKSTEDDAGNRFISEADLRRFARQMDLRPAIAKSTTRSASRSQSPPGTLGP